MRNLKESTQCDGAAFKRNPFYLTIHWETSLMFKAGYVICRNWGSKTRFGQSCPKYQLFDFVQHVWYALHALSGSSHSLGYLYQPAKSVLFFKGVLLSRLALGAVQFKIFLWGLRHGWDPLLHGPYCMFPQLQGWVVVPGVMAQRSVPGSSWRWCNDHCVWYNELGEDDFRPPKPGVGRRTLWWWSSAQLS